MTDKDTVNNCETYEQAILADPSFEGGGEHLAGCETCQALRAEVQALDTQLARALRVPVPPLRIPDLPPVDSEQVTVLPARKSRNRTWLALAASVALALFIGVQMFGGGPGAGVPLSEQILAHLEHEKFSMKVSDEAVSDDRLARIIPANVATLDSKDALITYAQSCIINGHAVPHLVMQGERGPVTILLMPEEQIDAPQRIASDFFNGVVLPVGSGSIAIVSEDGEDLSNLEETIKRSVTWDTSVT